LNILEKRTGAPACRFTCRRHGRHEEELDEVKGERGLEAGIDKVIGVIGMMVSDSKGCVRLYENVYTKGYWVIFSVDAFIYI